MVSLLSLEIPDTYSPGMEAITFMTTGRKQVDTSINVDTKQHLLFKLRAGNTFDCMLVCACGLYHVQESVPRLESCK